MYLLFLSEVFFSCSREVFERETITGDVSVAVELSNLFANEGLEMLRVLVEEEAGMYGSGSNVTLV